MKLKEQILTDLKEAMKTKDNDRLSAIRMIQSAVKNKEIELRPNEITDNEILAVLKKLVKQRQDAIEQYQTANRQDLVDKEKKELDVIESYLPRQLTRDELKPLVEEVIQETNAQSLKEMGQVMKILQSRTAGLADGRLLSEMVKSRLQGS